MLKVSLYLRAPAGPPVKGNMKYESIQEMTRTFREEAKFNQLSSLLGCMTFCINMISFHSP